MGNGNPVGVVETGVSFKDLRNPSKDTQDSDMDEDKVKLEKYESFFNPKRWGLLAGVFFGEMKFVLSNFLSNENLSSSYESWDVQLTFDTLINIFMFKA